MSAKHTAADLSELLACLDPQADLAQRHLWLIALVRWLRGDASSVARTVQRLQLWLDALQQREADRLRFQHWWRVLLDTVDTTALLADFGFTQRSAFASEMAERLRLKWLPGTPETADATALFALVLDTPFDAQWLRALDANTLARLADLLRIAPNAGTPVAHHAPSPSAMPVDATSTHAPQPDRSPPPNLSAWDATLLEALTFCTSQIRSSGFSPELRLRMSTPARETAPFHALAADFDTLQDVVVSLKTAPAGSTHAAAQAQSLSTALARYTERLDACRQAAASVYTHLEAHGISVNLVFQLRQLRARIVRIRTLLDCLLSPQPHQPTAALLAQLVEVGVQRRSLRALIAQNSSMLAAKVAERSSETGEHYITRTRAEYWQMLRDAAGGGAVMSLTTWLKFIVLSWGLSTFWSGFYAGLNYALSFVLIQMLHWTVATKQPAMTAPAMAAKLKDLGQTRAVEQFVDEVTHLVRSQAAAVLGNLALVAPAVLLLSVGAQMLWGQPMIDAHEVAHVLHSLDLRGPTALFAAFTGVMLFASSIIAGWVENWFVLQRLDSAMRYNPAWTAWLGAARAARWAAFMRRNISGLAANVSLGLMLGLVPAFASFFGLGLEVRHVTLSTGQLAAALGHEGVTLLARAEFWWVVAGLGVTGALNVGVSFYLAFLLALRAHGVSGVDRQRIMQALRERLRTQPISFFLPAKESPTHPTDRTTPGNGA